MVNKERKLEVYAMWVTNGIGDGDGFLDHPHC